MNQTSTSDAAALRAALADIDEHTAEQGWDQPPRLFALARTAELVRAEPALAAALGLESDDPADVTPIEQEEFPPDQLPLDEALARVQWNDEVMGAAITVERLLLPPSAESDLTTDDADELQRLAAAHPERRDVRLIVGVLRDGQRFRVIRIRGSEGEEVVRGDDLAPGLANALAQTFV